MTHNSTVDKRGGATWITLARGDRNMLDAELTEWLVAALRDADHSEPTAVVLTGAGDVFCGGADAPQLRETGTAERFADACVECFELLHTMRTPVIAAVNGDSLAGGFGLTCLADIVVAVDGAQLGTIEASLGGWAMIAQAPVMSRMPGKAAMTNLLTGVPFSAKRGRELGVVDRVVDGAALSSCVEEYVALLGPGRRAARLGRPMMRNLAAPGFADGLRDGANQFVEMFG